MAVSVRAATDGDKEFAREAHHEAFRDVVLRQFGRFGDEQDAFFEAAWDPGTYSIIEFDGEAAGYAEIIDTSDRIEVKQIVIRPRFHNRGAGTQLMTGTVDRARVARKVVSLQVLIENRAAQRLYERLGFGEIERTETHILMEWRAGI